MGGIRRPNAAWHCTGGGSFQPGLEHLMLTALILVCSLAVTPDLAPCTRNNAVDVMRVPTQFGNPAMCFMHSQALLADTAVGRDLADNERVKVICSPSQTTELSPIRPAMVQ